MIASEAIERIDEVLESEYRFDETLGYQLTSDDFEWLETAKHALEKHIPKKPLIINDEWAKYPACYDNKINHRKPNYCDKCPNKDTCGEIDVGESVLNLINCLKAENERLKTGMKNLVDKKRLYTENMQATREFQIEQAKSEAVKVFAERLKEEMRKYCGDITEDDIDNLLKEMG